MTQPLEDLIEMSKFLGRRENHYVILGEGNTSVRVDDESFWVKASGTGLAEAAPNTFVRVRSEPIITAINSRTMDDVQVSQQLKDATVEGSRVPSIETFLHALCLQLDGIQFVGHTHPTAAVALLSNPRSQQLFSGSVFPDQIVLLGPSYVYVPYADPGLPLAQAVQGGLRDYVETEGRSPRVVLLENHGVIALGGTAKEVINITQMLVKVCQILHATLGAGGPRFLSSDNVARIDKRPDELARRRDLR